MKLGCYICFFFLAFPFSVTAQELQERNFTTYTTANGLSDNTVTGIEQDAAGYIWLPTLSGLNRFDGSRFKQYHSNSDSCSPASEEFLGMTRLDKDRLAFFTAGLHIVNTHTGEAHNIFIPYHDRQYQYKFNMIMAARADNNGDIYVLSRSGFYHFDKKGGLLSRFDYYAGEKVANEHFVFGSELVNLDKNRLMITSIDGLYLYEKDKKQVRKMKVQDCPIMEEFFTYPRRNFRFFEISPGKLMVFKYASDTLFYLDVEKGMKRLSRILFPEMEREFSWRSKLVAENDSSFYVTGQNSGFFKLRFRRGSGSIEMYPEKYFSSYQCNAMFVDKDGAVWVATNKGLFRQNNLRSHVQATSIPPELENKFPGIRIHTAEISLNKIYAGTRAGGGLLVFDKASMQFEKQVLLNMLPVDPPVYKLSMVDPTHLLLGTGGSLVLYDEITGRETRPRPSGWEENDWTNELFKDRRGNIWISSENIYCYHTDTKTFSAIPVAHAMPAIPVAFAEDTSGHIWVAGHGITRYNSAKNLFDIRIDSFPYIKMPDKQVSAMVIDQHNTIWFGSVNNGLISYDIDKKVFRHFTRSGGLPDDNVSSLMIIGPKLWIACYSGIACMDLQTLQIKRFGRDEGLPDMPIMKGSKFSFDSINRQLYIGFYTSIVRFNPYEMIGIAARPSLFTESVNISGKKNIYLPTDKITTSWLDNDLTINIGSINFFDGQSQAYAYRIYKGESSAWQQLGNQHTFNISNLAPGEYRIQFKLYSLNNRWPEQVKEITIEVLPPFWRKPWFAAVVLLLFLGLLYLFIKWRIGLARKNEMEKTQVQKLMAEEYKNRYELEQISNYFSYSLADKKTTDEVLWDVAGHLIGRMNYEDCMIYLWNEDKTKMVQKAAYGLKGKPEYISSQVFDVSPGQGVVGHVIQSMQPVLVKDTRKDSRYRVDEAFRLSEVCVPIIHDNELLGAIDSEHHQADYFTERDIKILTTIATLVGNKLKQIESEKNLEVKQQELVSINEQLAEAKLSALQAQMNPHFVFNALNSIKRMILECDNEKASRYLSKFASMIRMTLNHSKGTFVTLKENNDYLETYLQMEQLRFDSSFTWHIDVSDDLDPEETMIPSLMIQPLVENAIWHGLLPSAKEKKLLIDFDRKLDVVICTIEDNGIGFRQSLRVKEHNKVAHHSVGLDNLRRRIKILNDKFETACSITIKDLEDEDPDKTGTRVILQFKIINP